MYKTLPCNNFPFNSSNFRFKNHLIFQSQTHSVKSKNSLKNVEFSYLSKQINNDNVRVKQFYLRELGLVLSTCQLRSVILEGIHYLKTFVDLLVLAYLLTKDILDLLSYSMPSALKVVLTIVKFLKHQPSVTSRLIFQYLMIINGIK